MKKTLSIMVALIILAVSAMPVFAAPSPTASKEYKIIVHNNEGGSGTYTTKIDKDGKHATITAHPKNGYKFSKWVIKGKYEIDEGDLTSKKLKILLKGDVEATPIFTKIGTKSTTPGTPSVIRNDSPTSPKTGDYNISHLFMVLALAAVPFAAVGIKLAFPKK